MCLKACGRKPSSPAYRYLAIIAGFLLLWIVVSIGIATSGIVWEGGSMQEWPARLVATGTGSVGRVLGLLGAAVLFAAIRIRSRPPGKSDEERQRRQGALSVDALLSVEDQAHWQVVPNWLVGYAGILFLFSGAFFGSLLAMFSRSIPWVANLSSSPAAGTYVSVTLGFYGVVVLLLLIWLRKLEVREKSGLLPKNLQHELVVIRHQHGASVPAIVLLIVSVIGACVAGLVLPPNVADWVLIFSCLGAFASYFWIGPVVRRISDRFYFKFGFNLFDES